jgi:hypothetical protein
VHEQAVDADHLPNTVALWQRVLCVPLETRPRSAALIPFGRRREVFSRVAAGAVDVASG